MDRDSNQGDVGTGGRKTTPQEEMSAFDRLPFALRAELRAQRFSYSAQDCLNAIRSGVSAGLLIGFIRSEDAKIPRLIDGSYS